jgi:hypothetical protein
MSSGKILSAHFGNGIASSIPTSYAGITSSIPTAYAVSSHHHHRVASSVATNVVAPCLLTEPTIEPTDEQEQINVLKKQISVLEKQKEMKEVTREYEGTLVEKMKQNEQIILDAQNENEALKKKLIEVRTALKPGSETKLEKLYDTLKTVSVPIAEIPPESTAVCLCEVVVDSSVGGGCEQISTVSEIPRVNESLHSSAGGGCIVTRPIVKGIMSSNDKWGDVPIGEKLYGIRAHIKGMEAYITTEHIRVEKTEDGNVIELDKNDKRIGKPMSIKEAEKEFKKRAKIPYDTRWYHLFSVSNNGKMKIFPQKWKTEKETWSQFISRRRYEK